MSTRSRIAIQTKNGEYRSVYHHYDGYPEGVGVTLQQHIPDYKSAVQLVRGGDISYIDWNTCLLYTSPSPRDLSTSRMPSSA